MISLGSMSRTCCYHPEGQLIALGFGGRVGKGKETGGGMVRIYSTFSSSLDSSNSAKVDKVAERTDAKQWISDVKFSFDGKTLIVGSHDCKIYIYSVSVKAITSGNRLSYDKTNDLYSV